MTRHASFVAASASCIWLLLSYTSTAKPLNVTVDDQNGPVPTIGEPITFSEGWSQDNTDEARNLVLGTFTQSSYNREGRPPTASLKFNGSAVYVSCFLGHGSDASRNYDMLFFLDGGQPTHFTLEAAPMGPAHTAIVFQADALSAEEHTIVIQNGRADGPFNRTIMLLDAITYTIDDSLLAAPSTSGGTSRLRSFQSINLSVGMPTREIRDRRDRGRTPSTTSDRSRAVVSNTRFAMRSLPPPRIFIASPTDEVTTDSTFDPPPPTSSISIITPTTISTSLTPEITDATSTSPPTTVSTTTTPSIATPTTNPTPTTSTPATATNNVATSSTTSPITNPISASRAPTIAMTAIATVTASPTTVSGARIFVTTSNTIIIPSLTTLTIPTTSGTIPAATSNPRKQLMIISICTSIIALVVGIAVLWLCWCLKRRRRSRDGTSPRLFSLFSTPFPPPPDPFHAYHQSPPIGAVQSRHPASKSSFLQQARPVTIVVGPPRRKHMPESRAVSTPAVVSSRRNSTSSNTSISIPPSYRSRTSIDNHTTQV